MLQTLYIIRHAEKPDGKGPAGVDANGNDDPESLTPRGWARAGAWAELFVPSLGEPSLKTPQVLFASAPSKHHKDNPDGSKSRRPLETITPLAEKLGLEVDLRFEKGQEQAIAKELGKTKGVVLVCWQHEAIFALAGALEPAPDGLPTEWPGSRFNVIVKLSRDAPGAAWSFEQIAPALLSGDATTPIASGS